MKEREEKKPSKEKNPKNPSKEFNVCNLGIKIHKGTVSVGKKSRKLGEAETINIGISVHSNSNEAIVEYCTVERPVKVDKPKTLNQLIDLEWRKCKADNKSDQFTVGQIVMAKMKGWTPWPCVIERFTNKKRAQVIFFGTNQTGSVDLNESVRMESSNEVIRLLLLRSLDRFPKGIREAESVLGISEENSIMREQAALN